MNNDGRTLVHLAALKGNVPLLIFLCEHCEHKVTVEKPDAHGALPLHLAAFQGHAAAVIFLIQLYPKGMEILDDEGMIPLHHACLCTYILPSPPQLKEELPVDQPQNSNNCFGFHIGRRKQKAILPISTIPEPQPIVLSPELVSAGVTIDPRQVLIHLLSHGSDSDIQEATGITPLMFASMNGQVELVKILLGQDNRLPGFKGADIRRKDDDQKTALHHGTLEGQIEVIRVLLQHDATLARPNDKAIVTSHDINLERPLHILAKNRKVFEENKWQVQEITDLFIAYGAELDCLMKMEKLPSTWQQKMGL